MTEWGTLPAHCDLFATLYMVKAAELESTDDRAAASCWSHVWYHDLIKYAWAGPNTAALLAANQTTANAATCTTSATHLACGLVGLAMRVVGGLS